MEVEKNKIYKIRRTKDGLFSNGKSKLIFSSKGRMWNTLKSLRLHLSKYKPNRWPYQGCEIVTYYIEEAPNDGSTKDIMETYSKKAMFNKLKGL